MSVPGEERTVGSPESKKKTEHLRLGGRASALLDIVRSSTRSSGLETDLGDVKALGGHVTGVGGRAILDTRG